MNTVMANNRRPFEPMSTTEALEQQPVPPLTPQAALQALRWLRYATTATPTKLDYSSNPWRLVADNGCEVTNVTPGRGAPHHPVCGRTRTELAGNLAAQQLMVIDALGAWLAGEQLEDGAS